jgi:hypothetical protein
MSAIVLAKIDALVQRIKFEGRDRIDVLRALDGADVDPAKLNRSLSAELNAAADDLFLVGSEACLGVSEADARIVVVRANTLIHTFDIAIAKFSRRYWHLCRAIVTLQREALTRAQPVPPMARLTGNRLENPACRQLLQSATLADLLANYRNEHPER